MTAETATSVSGWPRRHIGPVAVRWACVLAILITWEMLPRLGLVPPVMLASLSATLAAGVDNARMFADALAVTAGSLLSALAIAYGAGAVLGVLLGSVRPLRTTLLPLVSSIYAVPLVIVYPVLTAWVGIGPESKIIFGGLYGFFPMLLTTAAGVQTVDFSLLLAARSMGANRWQLWTQVMIPAALPSVVSGLRIGGAMAAIGVVVAEMMAATAGVGFLITQNRTMFNTAEVYFGILLVLLLAMVLDWLIRTMNRLAARHHPGEANS